MLSLQIEVFRTIQDNDGHHLTHNFRPTQPLGGRDVYFVTSSDGDTDENEIFGKNDVRLEDPPQDLAQTISNYRQSILMESTTFRTINNGDELDQKPVHELDQNDIVETTTVIDHNKFHKPRRNIASDRRTSTLWLIICFHCIVSIILGFKM